MLSYTEKFVNRLIGNNDKSIRTILRIQYINEKCILIRFKVSFFLDRPIVLIRLKQIVFKSFSVTFSTLDFNVYNIKKSCWYQWAHIYYVGRLVFIGK